MTSLESLREPADSYLEPHSAAGAGRELLTRSAAIIRPSGGCWAVSDGAVSAVTGRGPTPSSRTSCGLLGAGGARARVRFVWGSRPMTAGAAPHLSQERSDPSFPTHEKSRFEKGLELARTREAARGPAALIQDQGYNGGRGC